ncbi:cellulose synthase-like protein G3 isoform X1 [Chenopodium quinoa]|uniref:cellulose synthase-like protein G3 isoform X1 n=2 Tax=Chenopodium quinoa TaxID=63459 RepID=UPI000B797ACB|nr:cellulose synthase-like protein G3 isoform X1 [Chenopodium quinoa]
MEGPKMPTTTTNPPLHTHKLLRRRATFNRLYMAVYVTALLTFLYHHIHTLLNSSFTLPLLLLLVSDLVLAFSWVCTQSYHVLPIRRQEHLETLTLNKGEEAFPSVDIFICTADPDKEPPMGTVNTALSVMAYDYPPEKISVYVSDDGGSQVTLFAFMEAAKFGRHWLPFCRENNVVERCPEAYFNGGFYATSRSLEADKMKTMYESMKVRVENALERGKVEERHIDDEGMLEAFAKWTNNFTRQVHPTVIQVLLSTTKDKDVTGKLMPNLIYVSREKSKVHHHRFKAGALNALVRVSATMTNAPIVLTLDCDTYSNDPQIIKRALCYFLDPEIRPTLAYLQFPQIFRGLNKGDIYFSEHKRLFQINPLGMDGLYGPNYVGTGCFFQRRAFFGSPSSLIQPEVPELSPNHVVNKPIRSQEILELAHSVAACNYENKEEWGEKLGFRYGSLVEDYYTGYRMQCEGWRSMFCSPQRPAFLGDSPVTLIDLLSQCKRWINGLLDVLFSRYSTMTYGIQKLGLVMSFTYTHYTLWPIISIPFTIYAFIPQLALIKGISTFPEISDPRFLLYIFLFIGANGKDLIDFLLEKGTFERWWNAQRMLMICGLSSFLFGCIDYALGSLGITIRGFDVTSKLQDNELSKRYDQGTFEFGVASPMFVPMTMAAIINLISFVMGVLGVFRKGMENMEGLILQILLSGFVVINCWPLYQAMVFRSDKGRMPTKITLIAAFLASILIVGS